VIALGGSTESPARLRLGRGSRVGQSTGTRASS
jgi:hypothetical protein